MKRWTLFLLLCVSCSCFAQKNQSLDSLLCSIHDKDQSVRQRIQSVFLSGNRDSIMAASLQMNAVDQENQAVVFGILDKEGWPAGLCSLANSAIFLVIDHAALPAQEKYSPMVKEKADEGIIGKGDAATLQDRILMRKGEKQIYGTQTASVRKDDGTVYYLWPVENPDKLDELRKEVNLPPIADYIAIFKQQGMMLVWDKSLSVDGLKQMMGKN